MSTNQDITIKAIRAAVPEDLRRGDVIVVTHEQFQVLRVGCDAGYGEKDLRVDRVTCIPSWDAGRPMKVRAVCLPFVYAVTPEREGEAIDLRLQTIARLPRKAGRAVFDAMTPLWVREQKRAQKTAKKAQKKQDEKNK
ncbi:MAG: hypothetical protein AAGB29_07285 [Planctomycetota bacterium]